MLQALTTGGIPGFVDVMLNFDSKKLTEDNLITQLKRSGKILYVASEYSVANITSLCRDYLLVLICYQVDTCYSLVTTLGLKCLPIILIVLTEQLHFLSPIIRR